LVAEHPEEFVRRADGGELAFWEQAREPSEETRSVWVWVDVGPDQLGACRVVQIAVLLWLQKVCLESGGEFYWGLIQSPEKGYETFGAEELREFLTARSLAPPTRPPEPLDNLQTWCLGTPEWTALAPGGVVRVELSQSGPYSVNLRALGRRLELTLPSKGRPLRLLRDPLQWQLQSKPKFMPEARGRFTFSGNGRKIVVVSQDKLTLLPIPSSVNEPLGNPRVYVLPWQGEVIAVSVENRAVNLVQVRDEEWVFYRLNPSQADGIRQTCVRGLKMPDTSLGSCWLNDRTWELWLDGTLYEVVDEQLHVVVHTRGGCALGSRSILATPQGTVMDTNRRILFSLGQYNPLGVFFARASDFQVNKLGYTVAAQFNPGTWRLYYADRTPMFEVDGEVVGLFCDEVEDSRPALVVNRNGFLQLVNLDFEEPIDLRKEVVDCLVHPNGILCYQTESGELGCYDFKDRASLWMAQP
jgi:hypothetical protein